MHFRRPLGLVLAAAVVVAGLLLVVAAGADVAITVAAAGVLLAMYFLRRYARARLVYADRPPEPADASGDGPPDLEQPARRKESSRIETVAGPFY